MGNSHQAKPPARRSNQEGSGTTADAGVIAAGPSVVVNPLEGSKATTKSASVARAVKTSELTGRLRFRSRNVAVKMSTSPAKGVDVVPLNRRSPDDTSAGVES